MWDYAFDGSGGRDKALEIASTLGYRDICSLSSIGWRVGERRLVLFRMPLSSVLSPFVPHGERKKNSARVPHFIFRQRHNPNEMLRAELGNRFLSGNQTAFSYRV